MPLPTRTILALVALTGAATAQEAAEPPERQLLGAVDAGTYGERTLYSLQSEMRTNTNGRVAPHEVLILDSPPRTLLFCTLYDGTDTAVDSRHLSSGSGGPHSVFFEDYVPDATAGCGYFDIERVTRPPTGGVVVNRLATVGDDAARPASSGVVVNRLVSVRP